MSLAAIVTWLIGGGWRYAAAAGAVLAVIASYGAVWGHGYRAATARCEAAAIAAERDALKRDLANVRDAAADAERRATALRSRQEQIDEVVRDYEDRLRRRPAGACALGADDLRRLRRLDAR